MAIPNSALSTASDAFPITPSDTALLSFPTRWLVIGTAGALRVTTVLGNTVTLASVPVGVLPLQVTQVWATGTAASNISGLV